jgi:hypothetical protein
MNSIIQFLGQHQIGVTVVLTWMANSGFTILVTSLPAPTAQSSSSYQFWFKLLNNLAANLSRAKSTAVENSPNFNAAVQKAKDLGQLKP